MFNNTTAVPRGIEILTMVIAKSGTFNDQYRRPYQTSATRETVNAIRNRFEQINGNVGSISSGLFDGVASSFITPQATPASNIIIPSGWGTERYFYILKVKVYNNLGGATVEVIQGYSEYCDPSFSGEIDPRTRFYINSITRVINSRQMTPYGAQTVGVVKDSFQVIANNNFNGPQDFSIGSQADAHVSMRPQDVYSTLDASEYSSQRDLVDLRSVNIAVPKTTRRSNALAGSYTGEIVRAYADSVANNAYKPGAQHLYGDAIGMIPDEPLSKDQFVKALGNITGTSTNNNFQLQDLYRLDPVLASPMDQRIKIQRDQVMVPTYNSSGFGQMGGTPNAGDANHWQGSDQETLAATILANGLPALMVEVGLIHFVFQATNHSAFPVLETRWASGIAENYDCRPVIGALERRVQNELINQVSFDGQVSYQIYADVRIAQHTEINVQFENRPAMQYVSPTFADALMTPVITNDRERLSELSSDYGQLVQHLVQVQHPTLENLNSYSDI